MVKTEIFVEPMKFLKASRIDLVPKILYVRNKELVGSTYYTKLYLDHIRAFNSFNENHKKTKEDFMGDFDKLIQSIKKYGFNEKMKPIPSTDDFVAIDGAHRIASSIFFNNKVLVEILKNTNGPNYNYNYFRKRGLSKQALEEIVFNYLDIKRNNIYACIFWGSGLAKFDKKNIEAELRNNHIEAVYSKDVTLTETGKKNIIISCYEDEHWISDKKNDFSGAIRKVAPCFKGSNKIKFYLLESNNIENILKFKKNVRKKLDMGNHSIHTSDTYEETRNLCDILLNENSIFFINHSRIIRLPKELDKKNIKGRGDFAITSSYILEMFSIRYAEDIDYIHSGSFKIDGLGSHNGYFSTEEINELIYNPKNYFRFKGIKFLTLENILEFKKKRSENKDKRDIFLIEKFFEEKKKFDYKEKIVKIQVKLISFALKFIKKIPQSTRNKLKGNRFIMNFYKKMFC